MNAIVEMRTWLLIVFLAWSVSPTRGFWFAPAPKTATAPGTESNSLEDPREFEPLRNSTDVSALTRFRVVARWRINTMLTKLRERGQARTKACSAYLLNQTKAVEVWGLGVAENCKEQCSHVLRNTILRTTDPPVIRSEVLRIAYMLTSLDAFHAIYTNRPPRDDLSKRNTGIVTSITARVGLRFLSPRVLFVLGGLVRGFCVESNLVRYFDPKAGVGSVVNVGSWWVGARWCQRAALGWFGTGWLWGLVGAGDDRVWEDDE